jgi:hypothetical protein
MRFTASPAMPCYLRNSLLCAVAVAVALVLSGRVLVPGMSWVSTLGALVILLAYGGLAASCPVRLHQRHPEILRAGIVFGLMAGAVFAVEIVLEYVCLPADNTRYGVVEFGLVFLLYFASAVVSAFRLRSIKEAALTSVASAFIASLVWVITLLVVFYAFRGSPRQVLVLRAEGDYEDFARSGMSNFDVFIMQDLMGATFFHLLLGLVVAAVLGACGGVVGKVLARFRP